MERSSVNSCLFDKSINLPDCLRLGQSRRDLHVHLLLKITM
jgi:hypothetical protein